MGRNEKEGKIQHVVPAEPLSDTGEVRVTRSSSGCSSCMNRGTSTRLASAER
jgi:hypothetical protein